jgi:general secretion pathway protein B
MSFILDALKKSESDRQRASGPALFEVKVARTRSTLPGWGIALAALLGVNLAVLAWLLLLRHPPARGADTAAPPGGAALSVAAAPAGHGVPTAAASSGTSPASATGPVAAASPAPLESGTASAGAPPGASPPGAPAGRNPDDYAPAAAPWAPAFSAHVQRGTADGVPLYQEAVNAPGTHIPPLRLDLHVYSERPQERFVMINMHKLREGEALAEGVRVEAITPEGALLSYGGSRFLLTRD